MKRFFFPLAAMMCMSGAVYAYSLTGTVVSRTDNQPIPYATVSLLRTDSALLNGTITDETGAFAIDITEGSQILRLSFLGYKTLHYAIKGITDGQLFLMEEETRQLADVEVKAKRPLVERQMDKLVLNVSASPFALGSNGKELLKKAPGVNIDKDGKVTVNGKSVEVYIDGRPSHLSGEQLKAMLEGTDGSTIEKIEIISNPSAKYDAAGQGGIINIKTKRNMMKGLNGSLYASYGGMYFGDVKRWLNQDYFSLNLNYRTEKTYTFAQLTQVYGEQDGTIETGADYLLLNGADTTAMQRRSQSRLKQDFQYYVAKVGNDWFIDSKNTLGFILNIPIMKLEMNMPLASGTGRMQQWDGTGWNTLETNQTGTQIRMFNPQYNANINFTHVFSDSLNRELTVNVDYNRFNSSNLNAQQNTYTAQGRPDSTSALDINTQQKANIYSAKLDFQTLFWGTGMLEAGGKWALSTTGNRMTTDSVLNGLAHPTAHSDFDYSEHIAALYITAGKQFGKHWSAKLGLRGEYTFSRGNWLTADSVTERSYFNLFPTAFVGYNPTDKWGMSLSYTRRIDRPSYYQLNPFVTYIDAHTYMEGNPDLRPQFTHAVELQTNYSQYVSLALGFSHTSGLFAQPVTIMPNGDSRSRWENFGEQMQVGGNITLTELPVVPKYATAEDGSRTMQGAWLAMTINAGYHYFMRTNTAQTFNHTNHWGFVSGTLTSYLPKEWTLSVDGYYYAPYIDGYEASDGFYGMGLALKKSIMSKGLILSLQVQDLLRSAHWSSHSLGLPEGYNNYSSSVYRNQKVMLSLVWMFGTQQYVKRRNVGNVDEASRLGTTNSNMGSR